MNDLYELITHLKSCKDISSDSLKIRSSDLDESILKKFNIVYEKEAEAKTIDLSAQSYKIYKNKNDALSQRDSYKETDEIILINEKIIYDKDNLNIYFFENIFYTKKLKELFIKKNIISYDDELSEICILLSEKMGKLEVGYSKRNLKFFDKNNKLKELFRKIKNKLKEKEYDSFFRDNFIRIAKDIKSKNDSFYLTLIKLDKIYENSNREFELYKNEFSFEKFQSDLIEKKEKYIKNLNENLTDFLSKINSLPIQFGVYIFLIFRFKDEIIPLIGTIILIVTWSAFNINALKIMKKSIMYTKIKFEETMKEISLKSGIKEKILRKDTNEVLDRINEINNMIKKYRYIVIIFTLVFIIFSFYNIYIEVDLESIYIEILGKIYNNELYIKIINKINER